MARRLRLRHRLVRAAQRGQAFILILLLIGMAVSMLVYGMLGSTSLALRRDQNTAAALAQVKEALIGWSLQRTSSVALPNARPGELPCPDINPLDGFEDGSCAAGAIGRVPWKTLGIPEPKDDAGETLWYAIGGPFRIWLTNPTAINSDTKGNITVYLDSTATPLTNEAVAIIFAPGPVLGSQIRDATLASCPTTGTTIANNLCAANYLDSTGGINNATPNTNPLPAPSFIAAQGSGDFNDRLLVITTSDLIPPVEQRVARELRALLQAYKTGTAALGYNAGTGVYPWADLSTGVSDDGLNRSRVPLLGATPVDWPAAGVTIPAWLINNDWRIVTYYAVGRSATADPLPVACSSCIDPTLSVNGVPGTDVVLIMPGPAGATRPPGTLIDDPTFWQPYFEDTENLNISGVSGPNDLYVTPSSTAYTRDRIYTIP